MAEEKPRERDSAKARYGTKAEEDKGPMADQTEGVGDRHGRERMEMFDRHGSELKDMGKRHMKEYADLMTRHMGEVPLPTTAGGEGAPPPAK